MDKLIASFTKQIEEAIAIGKSLEVSPTSANYKNILVCGLGGSGIGGKIAGQLFADELAVPFQVVNDYFIPGYIDENSLVIASSYSGNTEETLEACEKAKKKGARIIAITSGGALQELSKKLDFDCIIIPSGYPPRAALAYSLIVQMFVLERLNLIATPVEKLLAHAVSLLKNEANSIKKEGQKFAEAIGNKFLIIYSDAKTESVAIRFRQQINENAKTLCWHHAFPELNHNELVGWGGGMDNAVVLALRTPDDYKRTLKRMSLTEDILKKKGVNWYYIDAKGNNKLEHFFYLIHLTDWVSFFLSEIRNCDPVEVKIIDYLKGELAKAK